METPGTGGVCASSASTYFMSGKIIHSPTVLTGGNVPEREGFVVWNEFWDICGLVYRITV
jgi:hypothetical protein